MFVKNAPSNNHVILADDDQDHAFLFERILRKVDPAKKLSVAKDGAALLELLSTLKPGLLFLDLKMPCKNGIECLKEIRRNPNLKDLPIVVYSSSSKMTDIQKSYVHKADLYMVKPFNTEHLENALRSVFNLDLKETIITRNHYFINNRFVPFTATGV
jgi:CheY-like chemotaxis protein